MASIIRSLRGGSTRKKRPQLVVTDEISSSSATNLQSSNRARDADLLYSTRSTSALMNDAVPSHYDELGISSPSAVSLIHVPTDLSGEDRWISMQQATFTNWVNDRLLSNSKKLGVSSNSKLRDLRVDLSDGTILIRLLELLTSSKIRGYEKSPKITAQKMVNLDLVFEHIKSQGIRLTGIGSQNVFQGDIKRILGLIWTLIQKYQLRMRGTHVSTKKVMLRWLQALLPSWDIHNLTTDWRDGRTLIALINEAKPGVAPDIRTLDPTKLRNNCTIAIRTARNHLKIPQLISPDDLAGGHIDELSMMTYLSYFCDIVALRLLRWIKKILVNFSISNFHSDWQDGRAFGALVDILFPGILPEWTAFTKENGEVNMAKVIEVTNRRLGVEPTFTARELARGETEELKVMTFVLLLRNGELRSLPEHITVSGPGIAKATAGRQTSFEIDTTEGGPGRLYIDSYYSDTGKKLKFSLHEKRPCVLTLSYTPEESGKVTFDILWSDCPVPNGPFTVMVTDSTLVKILDFEYHQRTVRVGVPIELGLNTQSAGPGQVRAQLQYGIESPIQAQVMDSSGGTVRLLYTPPKAGTPVLSIFWNGEKLTHLSIVYTVIDNKMYRITAKPEKKLYRTFEHAYFKVESANSLPLDVLQMTAIYGEIQIPINFKAIQDRVGHAAFTPTLPGEYRIEVVCIDRLVEGCPFMVTVADPSRCRVLGILPKYLQCGAPYDFKIEKKDAGEGSVELECSNQDDRIKFLTEVCNESREIQRIAVIPHKCGEFLLGLKFQGTHIPSSPFRVTVCDPSLISVVGDLREKKSGIVGKPLRFKILNPHPSGGLKPIVKALGPSAKYSAEMRTTDDRTYSVQFTPWEVGTHEITVTYGGFNIPNSPFLVAVTGFDSNICSATGTGLQEALTGVPAQFVVLAKQSGLLDDGTLQLKVEGVINKVECKVRARDNGNGTYNIAYLTQVPGAYLISVIAGSSHIPGSPFRLTALQGPEADKCSMFGPALEPNAILVIGKPIDFSVDTVGAGTGQLLVKAVGPGGTQSRVYVAKTSTTGRYDIKLDPVRHGKYRVSVKWSGRHIPGSPFILKIFPGADPSKCKAYGPGLQDGFVGKRSSFTIETRDAGAGTLKVRLHGVKDAFRIEIKPAGPQDVRTLEARYDPRKPGEYLVTIRWENDHIPGSPFRVKITGDEMDFSSDEEPRPIPRHPHDSLGVIEEEEEEEQSTGHAAPSSRRKRGKDRSRKRSKQGAPQFIPVIPVAVPGQKGFQMMPIFNAHKSRTPYNFQFVPGTAPKERASDAPAKAKERRQSKDSSKTVHFSSSVHEEERSAKPGVAPSKMMTFSNLQQVRQHQRKHPTPSEPIGGVFHGQAAMHINTVTRKAFQAKHVKRSISG